MRGCGIGVSNIIFHGDFLKTVKKLPEKRKQSTKPPTSLEKEKPSTQQKFSTFSFEPAIIKPSRGTLAKADGRIEQIGLDARTARLMLRRMSEER